MLITGELAQQIVDHIMPIVQQNVNIMNSAGMIVGSGQKNRVNTYHQGAKEVIAKGQVVEISPHELEQFPGSLPGLNWPIILDNQIVGVVGVSGNPETVRNTAKLVKMVTELILERESLIEEFRSSLQLKEHFIQLILSNRWLENITQVKNAAHLLRFTLELPRMAAVVNIRPIVDEALSQYGTHDLVMSRTREILTQRLEASELINDRDMFVFAEDELIVLKHFPENTGVEALQQWGERLICIVKDDYRQVPICLGLGSLSYLPEQLYYSYHEAVFAYKSSSFHRAVASVYDFNILVSYLLAEEKGAAFCLAFQNLQETIETKLGLKYDMRNTITTLLEYNLNVSVTAKALFIHRNTLVFRLEKLQQLTGLCPAQFLNHAILCKLLFLKSKSTECS
jgi:carbohydrate diacid regulator